MTNVVERKMLLNTMPPDARAQYAADYPEPPAAPMAAVRPPEAADVQQHLPVAPQDADADGLAFLEEEEDLV